jgi:hypothetical protein
MNSSTSPSPFSKTELQKLLAVTTMTHVAKLALKAGNTVDDLIEAGVESQYTRQGVYSAIRKTGKRVRAVRSDKGLTLKRKINRLIEEARALEARLEGEADASPI